MNEPRRARFEATGTEETILRLAELSKWLMYEMRNRWGRDPDVADFLEAFYLELQRPGQGREYMAS